MQVYVCGGGRRPMGVENNDEAGVQAMQVCVGGKGRTGACDTVLFPVS